MQRSQNKSGKFINGAFDCKRLKVIGFRGISFHKKQKHRWWVLNSLEKGQFSCSNSSVVKSYVICSGL